MLMFKLAASAEVIWSQLLKLGELMRDEPSNQSHIFRLYFDEENPSDIAIAGGSGHTRPTTKVM